MTQLTGILYASMESVFNGLLRYDPETRAALAELAGRSIAIEVTDLSQSLHLLPVLDGLKFSQSGPVSSDVTIRGHATALLGMLRQRVDNGNTAGQVEIKGDIHLAQRLQAILREMNIDWEEFLSRYLGDTAAHKIGRLGRDMRTYLGESLLALGMDISEYLRYERRWLPARIEVDNFLQDVDHIRDDVERAQQRLARLEMQQGERR